MKNHSRLALGLNLAAALTLAACGHGGPPPAVPSDRIVEVKVPVVTQPITKDQIPPLPGQLPPRPDDPNAAALIALGGRCDAIAFVIKAWPLLLLSAGEPPQQAPDFPECDKK